MSALGTQVEHRLLDALMRDNRQAPAVESRVTGLEFSHPSMGAVFDGMLGVIGRGGRITVETVADHFEAWGATGVGFGDPFVWTRSSTLPSEAPRLADQIRSAFLRREGRAVALDVLATVDDGAVPPDVLLAQTATRLRELIDGATTNGLTSRPLSAVLNEEDQDTYDWVIPYLLERRERLVITGPEGNGKTTLLRQLAIGLAAGVHPFTRRPMPAQRVLVIDTENDEKQWRRNARWIVRRYLAHGAQPDVADRIELATSARFDIRRSSVQTAIHRLIDRTRPDVVFIGPLYRLIPVAVNGDDEAAPLIAALDQIRDRNIALVMEAHAGKSLGSDGDRNLAPRGSSALLGWPEFGIGMQPMSDDNQVVRLVRWRGDRDQRDWPQSLYRGVDGDLPWMASMT